MIDAYAHPFLRGKREAFQHICNLTGQQAYGNLKAAERIAKQLDDAHNGFVHGMTVESFHSHNGTDIHDSFYWSETLENKLKGHTLTKKQVEDGGYVVTNILWKFVDKGRKQR